MKKIKEFFHKLATFLKKEKDDLVRIENSLKKITQKILKDKHFKYFIERLLPENRACEPYWHYILFFELHKKFNNKGFNVAKDKDNKYDLWIEKNTMEIFVAELKGPFKNQWFQADHFQFNFDEDITNYDWRNDIKKLCELKKENSHKYLLYMISSDILSRNDEILKKFKEILDNGSFEITNTSNNKNYKFVERWRIVKKYKNTEIYALFWKLENN